MIKEGNFTMKLSLEEKKAMEERAKEIGTSKSNYIRMLVNKDIREKIM
ncbi:plasmid mobilization protein [Cetobacterium sp.]